MKKKSLSFQLAHGVIVLMGLITLVFFLLASFAVFYHNKNATNGYKLKIIEQQRASLVFEIETLEMQIADLSSLSSLGNEEERQKTKNNIIYLHKKP